MNSTYSVLSETSVTVDFGTGIDPAIHNFVKSVIDKLSNQPFPGFVECLPSYIGLTVVFNPIEVRKAHSINHEGPASQLVIQQLKDLISKLDPQKEAEEGTLVTIPVCYGGEYGPDLRYVAQVHGLTEQEVIDIHTKNECLVYMMGFAPGFSFLGGMDKRIATPRKSEPRAKIPVGSVGIAGEQTGAYSIETPGGWQLIGQTPYKLFDSTRSQPSLLMAGNRVRFQAITEQEFLQLKEDTL